MSSSSRQVSALTGYISAVPCPFAGDEVDYAAFVRHCDWQVAQGINALVVNGTTGEAPTLETYEQGILIHYAAASAAGRVPVIAGIGANATRHAIALAAQATRAGADALLAVTPYYNRPSQEGLFQHFRAIHEATDLPILLYDVPSRTGCRLEIDTIRRLAALPRIVGLKDATGDLTRPVQLRQFLGEDFRLFSGDDATALDFMILGGNGCISVLSNVVPAECGTLYTAFAEGRHATARMVAERLAPLSSALFAEANPVPLKWALSLMGRMSAELRLPLTLPGVKVRHTMAAALTSLGLIVPGQIGRARQQLEKTA